MTYRNILQSLPGDYENMTTKLINNCVRRQTKVAIKVRTGTFRLQEAELAKLNQENELKLTSRTKTPMENFYYTSNNRKRYDAKANKNLKQTIW